MRLLAIITLVCISASSLFAQCKKQKSYSLEDGSEMTIFYGKKSKKPFNSMEYDSIIKSRIVELDSLTKRCYTSFLNIKGKEKNIDSIRIHKENQYTLVLKHAGHLQGIYSTQTEGDFKERNVYVFSPIKKKLKYVFQDNEIRSLEHFNRNNEREGEQIYFSHHRLDSAYVLIGGKKVELEYTLLNGREVIRYRENDSMEVLDNEAFSNRIFYEVERSYYWLYPRLLQYNIEIPESSVLYNYELRSRMEELIEKSKDD